MLAVVFHRHPAVHAQPATRWTVDDHRVSRRESCCAGPELLDPACVLMSERKRKPKRHIAAGLGYLQDVQIGVAGSRAPDLHQDLTRPGFGKRDLTKFARLLSEASEQVSTPLSMSTSSMCRHVCIHIIENGSPPRKTRATPSLCISMSPRDSMYCGSTLPWASSTSRPRPGSWVPPDQPPTPYVSSNWRRQGSIQMADDSNTSPPTAPPLDDDESNRVSALAALYQAEQSTLSSLDSQVLVLVGLLVTYGIAAVAPWVPKRRSVPIGCMWRSLFQPGFCWDTTQFCGLRRPTILRPRRSTKPL